MEFQAVAAKKKHQFSGEERLGKNSRKTSGTMAFLGDLMAEMLQILILQHRLKAMLKTKIQKLFWLKECGR